MKEMVYGNTFLASSIDLHRGSHLGYEYSIKNLGPYPTAYVSITKGKASFNIVDSAIDCHGGCTYNNLEYLWESKEAMRVIGWDYGHVGDFVGLLSSLPLTAKKWTTEEIDEECKRVISSLYALDNWKSLYM